MRHTARIAVVSNLDIMAVSVALADPASRGPSLKDAKRWALGVSNAANPPIEGKIEIGVMECDVIAARMICAYFNAGTEIDSGTGPATQCRFESPDNYMLQCRVRMGDSAEFVRAMRQENGIRPGYRLTLRPANTPKSRWTAIQRGPQCACPGIPLTSPVSNR